MANVQARAVECVSLQVSPLIGASASGKSGVGDFIGLTTVDGPAKSCTTKRMFETLQCGAPKIAKLVYNSSNYGLWYL